MLAPFFIAVQMLTRLPAPSYAPEPRRLAWSAVFYPVVGGILALAGLGIYQLLTPVLPAGLVALLMLAAWMLLTGGLHEDGLADCADALGAGGNRERMFAILKDSRIGTFGALALIVSVLLRWQSLTLLAEGDIVLAVIMAQVLPRAGIVVLAWWAGPAREGSGARLAQVIGPPQVLLSIVVAAALTLWWGPARNLGPVVACFVIVLLMGVYLRKGLGGITGDCLGAAAQVQEAAVLLYFVAASGVR